MKCRGRGFTLIELLVVIAVTALLIGILLPALGSARGSARTAEASAAMRSLMQGYAAYAGDHGGFVVPGAEQQTQTSARSVVDEFGEPQNALSAERWLYRFGPTIEHRFEGTTHVGTQARLLEARLERRRETFGEFFNWGYTNSLYPSFGLNVQFAGGRYEVAGVDTSTGFPASYELVPFGQPFRRNGNTLQAMDIDWYRSAVTRRLSDAFQPSRFITAVSARFETTRERQAGFWRVFPPVLGTRFDADRTTQDPFTAFGHNDLRYGDGGAVTGFFDGHAEVLDEAALLDRTRWIDEAARAGDPEFEPPAP